MRRLTKYILVIIAIMLLSGLVVFFSLRNIGDGAKLIDISHASETDPGREYIVLEFNPISNTPAILSNFYLENDAGLKIEFPKAAHLPAQGAVNETSEIKIEGENLVVLSTGKSPIGVSFQENKCTGYLGQFQNYYPALENSCPTQGDTIARHEVGLLPECEQYVRSLPACETKLYDFPEPIAPSCQAIIRSYVHYNACTEVHKNDPDFYLPVWRLYLNSKSEVWEENDTIKLFDQSGKLLDIKSLNSSN